MNECLHSTRPEFLAVYGRGRVDKTYLIKTYFSKERSTIFFNVTGTKDGLLAEQIKHFIQRIGEVFLSMVTARGLSDNLYADDLISGIVMLEDFYD